MLFYTFHCRWLDFCNILLQLSCYLFVLFYIINHLHKHILLPFVLFVSAFHFFLFGNGVLYIPLSMVGFLQYIAPTIMLFIGVVLYDEPFTQAHIITFSFIWVSLVLYMASSVQQQKKANA